jgi:branched-chain amino acid transport system permease protein
MLERLLSLTASGVMLGGILALGSVGLTLVYGILRFGNFAHGDLMTVGAYVALAVMAFLPSGPPLAPFSFGWEFLVALLVAMPVTGIVALAADRLIYSHLRRRRSSAVILAMASLGVAFFVRSIIYLAWGSDFKFYYQGRIPSAIQLPLGVQIRPDQVFTFVLACVLVILIYILLEKTKIGKAMRATADNPTLARVSGIAIDRVIFWTWIIGGALAGASGVMLGLNSQVRPEMGWLVLLPLFAAVILGSIGNPYGALVGALIIGIIREVSSAFLNPTYGPGVAFLVMIIILLVRPQGLFRKGGY